MFNSFSTQTVVSVEYDPSLSTYQKLQTMHPSTVQCPCSNMTMAYKTFAFLSPTFHQVCSSDLVSDSWISLLTVVGSTTLSNTWFTEDGRYFQLLSTLCQSINQIVVRDVHRFLEQTLATSYVDIKTNFEAQLDATMTQFTQSISISFTLLIDAMRTFLQIDQPLTIFTISDYAQLVVDTVIPANTDQSTRQVRIFSKHAPSSSL